MKTKMSITLILCTTLLASSCNGSHNTNEATISSAQTDDLLAQASAEKSAAGKTKINATPATVQSEIKNANKAGKVVFLVVTEPNNADNDGAMNMGKSAQKLHPKSVVVKMNRADAANKELVTKYGLSGAPLPLLLVISSNGVLAGGAMYKQATAKGLVAMIPSPKKAEVLLAINQGKSVFVVVSKKSMLKKKDVLSKCELACKEMNGKAKVIEIDLEDIKEKRFLNELKVNQTAAKPQTYVINTKGQLTGSLSGVVNTKTLIATATKKVSGGCCAPGSGKSCGPAKKK